MLGGAGLLILLDGALVKPARTEQLILRQEEFWLLILVAVEGRRATARPPERNRRRRGAVYTSSLVGGKSKIIGICSLKSEDLGLRIDEYLVLEHQGTYLLN